MCKLFSHKTCPGIILIFSKNNFLISRYASNESLNNDGSIYRPRTGRLGRQASTESLNRVAFASQDPPSWSTGRRFSRSETPNYIEVFRASLPDSNADVSREETSSTNHSTKNDSTFSRENDAAPVRPKTTHVRFVFELT